MGDTVNVGLCEEMPTVKEYMEKVKKKKAEAEIVEQIIPDELGAYIIVAGRTGLNKTNLCMSLSYSIATGTPFLRLKCKKMPVFYFTQLLGVALGLDESELGFDLHHIDPRPVLTEKSL